MLLPKYFSKEINYVLHLTNCSSWLPVTWKPRDGHKSSWEQTIVFSEVIYDQFSNNRKLLGSLLLSCTELWSQSLQSCDCQGKGRLPMSRLQQTYKFIFNLHLRTRYTHTLLSSIISSDFDFYQDYTKLISTTDNRVGSAVFWLNYRHSFLWRGHMIVHSLFKKQNKQNQEFLLL